VCVCVCVCEGDRAQWSLGHRPPVTWQREASKDEDGVGGNHQRYEIIRRGDGGVPSAGQVRVEEVVSWFGYASGSCGKGKGVV